MLTKFVMPLGAAALAAAAPALHERCPDGDCVQVSGCVDGQCDGINVAMSGCTTGDCAGQDAGPAGCVGDDCVSRHAAAAVCVDGRCEVNTEAVEIPGCTTGDCVAQPPVVEAPACEGPHCPDMTGQTAALITQAVVYVDEAGAVICTITETITAEPPSPPTALPPSSPKKVVEEVCEECVEPQPPKKVVEEVCEECIVAAPPKQIVEEVCEECIETKIIPDATTIYVSPVPMTPTAAPSTAVVGAICELCNENGAPVVDEGCQIEHGCQPASSSVVVQNKPSAEPAPVAKVVKEKVEEPCENCGETSALANEVVGAETTVEKDSSSRSGNGPQTGNTHGVSYAAYRGDHGCKTEKDINDDFDDMDGKYSVIRTYGVDCGQVPIIYEAAQRHSMKILYGIWDINRVEYEANMIIEGINSDWEIVHSISVGNELVNNGEATAEQVITAVKRAREILRAAGYTGPVVAVDTFIAVEKNLSLCEASDYCAINAHAFFDSTIPAGEAGPWLARTVESIRSKLGSGKKIIVTETGWPTQGQANGRALPGMANQKMALESISKTFSDSPGEVFLFSAFNDLWKGEADKYWGVGGATSRCDQ